MNSVEHFWSLAEPIPETGCWIWNGGLGKNGYGRYSLHGKRELAHRISFRLANKIDISGMCICHRCDVPLCVNPVHLFAGTQRDNLADMRAKGRDVPPPSKRGEAHYEGKLTDESVRSIRARRAAGERLTEIADAFNVTPALISHIATRRKWKHVA